MADAEGDHPAPFAQDHGLLSWLDVTVESFDSGVAVLALPARDDLRNHGQAEPAPMHGGVISTLIDTAAGVALRTAVEDPSRVWQTTTNLDLSYLRPATGDLRATAEVLRAGRSMAVIDVTVTSETADGEATVAVGRANYRLIRQEEP